MGDRIIEGLVTVMMGIVGIAIVATLVGQHAQTAGVASAAGQAFGSDITAAEGPVLGG